MTIMEIALLVIGVIIFVISFLLPDTGEKKTDKEIAAEKEEVHKLLEQEIDGMKLKVNEATNDTVEYAVGKAERSLEKVSNEKIMAVNEYAGTIIEEINKNHKEVMFLYDMLRDKQSDLTNAVRKADATVKEIEQVSHTAQAASETLLRGMSVASVSQKGLTQEQKAVFDDISIPDAEPVVFKEKVETIATGSSTIEKSNKPRGVALAQSKIFAGLTGKTIEEVETVENHEAVVISTPKKEAITYDLLSGSAYKDGSIVGVNAATGRSVTAADYAALVSGESTGLTNPTVYEDRSVKKEPVSQAPGNNNDKIIELSKQGMDTIAIARALNLGVGEVKLVLDLFK